jgi:IMP dehydrogenase
MLSTTANPTDGLDSTVLPTAPPAELFIPQVIRGKLLLNGVGKWR